MPVLLGSRLLQVGRHKDYSSMWPTTTPAAAFGPDKNWKDVLFIGSLPVSCICPPMVAFNRNPVILS